MEVENTRGESESKSKPTRLLTEKQLEKLGDRERDRERERER